ncbi:MAG: hypothetical protein AAGC95_08815 [Pseudomonadota bacterium]
MKVFKLFAVCVAAVFGSAVAAHATSGASGGIDRFADRNDGLYFDIGASSGCAPGYEYKLDADHTKFSEMKSKIMMLWEVKSTVFVTAEGAGCDRNVITVSF